MLSSMKLAIGHALNALYEGVNAFVQLALRDVSTSKHTIDPTGSVYCAVKGHAAIGSINVIVAYVDQALTVRLRCYVLCRAIGQAIEPGHHALQVSICNAVHFLTLR